MNLYQDLLGARWTDLPAGVRNAHAIPLNAAGDFVVLRGNGRTANLLADVLRLPRAGTHVQVRLCVVAAGSRVLWKRTFGDLKYATSQVRSNGLLVERSGAAAFVFALEQRGDRLYYRQVAFRFLGVRMPRALWMHVRASVDPAEEGWRVKVSVRAPFAGLLCRYAGNMRAE